MRANDIASAESRLDDILRLRPSAVGALRLKAQISGVLAKSSELSRVLLRIVQQDAFTLDDLLILASSNAYIDDGERLRKLELGNSANVDLLLPKARAALNKNQSSEAIELLSRLVAERPDNWEAQALLGRTLTGEDDHEFLNWQAQLSADADNFAGIWLARGLWLEKTGETRPAARCFNEALNLEPELVSAVSHLSQCVRLNGETEIAKLLSDRATLMLKVRDLATRIEEQQTLRWAPELIEALEKLGRIWEAWAWSEMVARTSPLDQRWRSKTVALAARRSSDGLRTDPKYRLELTLDWSNVPVPDWSQYSMREAIDPPMFSRNHIRFREDAERLGIRFTYQNKGDAKQEGNLIYESTGGGAGVVDVDADSWPDLYIVQGGSLHAPTQSPSDKLFRNRRGLNFDEISSSAGIQEDAYGQGIAVGDINNDGFDDVYVANIGRNRLLLNNGDGTFRDFSDTLSVTDPRWTISAGIADMNRDGNPEIIDINYCEGKEPLTTVCVTEQQKPRACRPTIFNAAPDVQLWNEGDEAFRPLFLEASSQSASGRGMGLVIADFDQDDNLDMFVANDQSPNHLFMNASGGAQGSSEFRDEALVRGVGLDRDGFALAFMGIASSDLNRDGIPDLFVTTFSQETPTLFLSQQGGQFTENTREAGLRAPCFPMLGFGTQFLDADHDGHSELLILNGHIDSFPDSGQQYQMKPQLFRGLPDCRFEEIESDLSGEFFAKPRLGRALVVWDWNKDCLSDFVATDLESPTEVCTNESETLGKALFLRCIGTSSSRDATGAKITLERNDGESEVHQLMSGHGYECSNERLISASVPNGVVVTTISIRWPSGLRDIIEEIPLGSHLTVVEGRPGLYVIPR